MANNTHISSHRLHAAATTTLILSLPEVQHLEHCGFCNGIFEFFQHSRQTPHEQSSPAEHESKAA